MIDQTIPLEKLTAGMANCVREWILPHLTDAMARIQAEQLIGILQWLPRSLEPGGLKLIKADSDEARALLKEAGEPVPSPVENYFVNELMAENAAVKEQLQSLADRLRLAKDPESARMLLCIQRYFVRSIKRESEGASVQFFAEMTIRDREGKQDLTAED